MDLHRAHGHAERGDVVLGWLTRVVVALAAVGLVAFDAISIGASRLAVADTASLAAREASEAWASTKDVQVAYDAATATAREANPLNEVLVDGFAVDPDGTVHLVVRREATTFLVHRVEQTRPWGVVESGGSGRSV